IQATTGWSNSGTYGFSHEYKEYGPRNREFDRPELSDRHTRIEDLLTNQGDRLVYYYGPNGWQYDVILDAINTVANDVARPGVTAGEGAFPLENMDRSVHYTELLGLIASLEKVDGGGMKTLDGSPWDPTVVDIQAEDDRLQQF